jgi:membrane protein DedA with SNARE-associated domain
MPGLLDLIATYGYIVVFGLVAVESAGVPLPGETALLVAAALAATGHGWLPGVIGAAALGAIAGDTVGYWVGRTSGLRVLRRHGRFVRVDAAKLARAETFFERHGDKTVFLGRFVPVGRIFAAVLAGVSRMRYRRFLLWNASGGIVWACGMGTLGYLFGSQLPLIEHVVGQLGLWVGVALVTVVAARVGWTRRGQLGTWPETALARVERWWADLRTLPLHRYRWQLVALSTALVLLGLGLGGLMAVIM